ncbi:Ig-like domain-containing protein [Anaerosporobacter sp.]|uniref:Ig-like domain-containing protein n=1 Tax=Anaerosporobacter sp. TaxID=1872529 RepID=UPI00286EEBBF|nr:Ig-like domain-containing protein [Anaerosporobacter sp.]
MKIVVIAISILVIGNYLYKKTSLYFFEIPHSPVSLHLNKESVVLEKGETFRVSVFVINKRVYYSSTDFKVAYVNLNGKVFAKKPGVAFIVVKVGKKTLKCKVRVIAISKKSLTLDVGERYQLHVEGDGILKGVTWKSSNSSVAYVNKFGYVTAKRKGTTVITAKVYGKKLTCKLKVE